MRILGHMVASVVLAFAVGVLVTMFAALAGAYEFDSESQFPWGAVASALTLIGYWVWRLIRSSSTGPYDAGAPPVEQPPEISTRRDD